jgi:predicted O-methyltransferase YrrM
MFHNIPEPILACMQRLEAVDAQERTDATPGALRLRQVPPETGRFLAIVAAGSPEGAWIELGTSGGYSALWISLAAMERGQILTTMESDPQKIKGAQDTFLDAGISASIQILEGDARELLGKLGEGIAFCFLDIDKEYYQECYELVLPHLVGGGVLVADNLISHADELADFRAHALTDERVDAIILPVGKGLLLARRLENPLVE